ncbi:hypothetical protein [Cohaesibacter gelatinilyticus]|uniref:Uncharacterized protein n=1 Tax=Cohaesibacter gelatinilyticus TaxID=372072 RepID=A0A285PN64_9HYPH|nr:hypothetical protein [Cohaesibacter gelatinilyticus]SNZ21331.1 hypothetical protein SAMN06265368_4448 [Cohaesibacter gelatinilyticus]
MSSNKEFNIAARGTDAQKERFESEQLDQQIKRVQTPEFRRSLQELQLQADVTIEALKEELAHRRDRFAQFIIDQKVSPHPELNLKPDGARNAPDWEHRNEIRSAVDNRYKPEHKKQIEEKRKELYSALRAEIELTLKDENELQKSVAASNSDESISEAKSKLEQIRENSRDITQRLNRPRGLGKGRSR